MEKYSNIGLIDSVEPMGLVDGPGLRFVVFFKGCKLRCLFCHNPETWECKEGTTITSEELIKKIHKFHTYYTDGGVTFSGGEPLIQKEFLLEMLKKCKMINLHTALDTAGVGNGNYDEILKYTDLVLLDIKAYKEDDYKKITGFDMTEFNKFLEALKRNNNKIWIRQVIIPTINDTEEYILGLKEYLKNIPNIEKIELLPYHLYGVDKYKKLGIKYPLEGIEPMNQDKLNELEKILNQ